MYNYKRDYTFEPELLHRIDYHVEGSYGSTIPVELFDEYQKGNHGHEVFCFIKKAPLIDWKKNENRMKTGFFHLREI